MSLVLRQWCNVHQFPILPGRTRHEYLNLHAYAALKGDGSVITWGNGAWGGNSSSVSEHLSSGVRQIFSTRFAFAALKDDGSVVTWGAMVHQGCY